MRGMKTSLLLMAIATGGLFGCGGSVGPTAEMSLQRVVLYQNGLGYFERTGRIAQASLPLRFNAHEVDDVLATMTLQSGGERAVVSASVPQREADEADDDVVTLDLRPAEASQRELTLSYAVPTPAWRGSYRVVLPEGRGEGEALFQIWALVHNSSPEDWNHVLLALSTAAPISYEVDQRTPEFVSRPNATGQLVAPPIRGPIVAETSRAPLPPSTGVAAQAVPQPSAGARHASVAPGMAGRYPGSVGGMPSAAATEPDYAVPGVPQPMVLEPG